MEVLHANLGGTLHEITVGDPLGRDVGAQWLQVGDVAYIEAAQANGLARLEPDERDPWRRVDRRRRAAHRGGAGL